MNESWKYTIEINGYYGQVRIDAGIDSKNICGGDIRRANILESAITAYRALKEERVHS